MVWLLLGVLLGPLLGGCLTPATGLDSYRGKAAQSLSAAGSNVAAAQTVVGLLLSDRVLHAYADEVLSGSEQALDAVVGAFSAVQPPPEADQLYRRTSALLGRSATLVRDCRIAARRSDLGALARLEPRLALVGRRLSAAETALP